MIFAKAVAQQADHVLRQHSRVVLLEPISRHELAGCVGLEVEEHQADDRDRKHVGVMARVQFSSQVIDRNELIPEYMLRQLVLACLIRPCYPTAKTGTPRPP